MVEFRKARKEEAEDIIDFINYVFSQNSRPHDFKKMCPDVYACDRPFWEEHYVAVEDGKICATVMIMDETRELAGEIVKIGHVEQVSVHPYRRGKGYMQKLMGMALEDMISSGYDCSLLSGQRQRYEYFGYEPANYRYVYEINKTNIRHVVGNRELTVELKEGQIGGNYVRLDDYAKVADVIARYLRETGCEAIYPEIPLYDIDCAKALSKICENVQITNNWAMMRIFNFRKILTVGLKLRAKAGLCSDGELTLAVGDERFGLRVHGSDVESFDCETAQYTFEPKELSQLALLMTLAADDTRIPRGWFPITL